MNNDDFLSRVLKLLLIVFMVGIIVFFVAGVVTFMFAGRAI